MRRFRLLLIKIILMACYLLISSNAGKAVENIENTSDEKIYVQIFIHFESTVYPKESFEVLYNILSLFDRYNTKPASLEIRATQVPQMAVDAPELVELIKQMRIPIQGNQETHIQWPASSIKDLSWDEAVKKILHFETHLLNPVTGEVESDKEGGWLALENVFGVTPFSASLGADVGVHGYVTSQLKHSGAPYEVSPFIDIPTNGLTISFGPYFTGEGFSTNPQEVPHGNHAEALESIINCLDVRRITMRLEEQNFYCDNMNRLITRQINQDGWPLKQFAGPPLMPDDIREKRFEQFHRLFEYMAERPEKFQFVWADPEENQWKAGPIPERDFSQFPWHLGEERELTLAQLETAAQHILYNRKRKTLTVETTFTDYIPIGGKDGISLSEAYYGFASALSYYEKNGTLPVVVKTRNIIGPVDYKRRTQPLTGNSPKSIVGGRSVITNAARIFLEITDRVPSEVVSLPVLDLKGEYLRDVNPAEMLVLMANVTDNIYRDGNPGEAVWFPVSVRTDYVWFGFSLPERFASPEMSGRMNASISQIYEQWHFNNRKDQLRYNIAVRLNSM